MSHNNYVLATGYNGTVRGQPHCTDAPCAGALLPSGTGLDVCEAIHAEQNALMQCADINKIKAVYCTALPCPHCLKMLMNTSVELICFIDVYPANLELEQTPQHELLQKIRHRTITVGQYAWQPQEVRLDTKSAIVRAGLRLDPFDLTPTGTWHFPHFGPGRRDEGPQPQ